MERVIMTIGHSTRSIAEFIAMLQTARVEVVVDVRRFPGSRKFPEFNRDDLARRLNESGIDYLHLEALGGRRRARSDSRNRRWRNASFRGYADYMETEAFGKAVAELEAIARKRRVAIMCAEAVWWRCHRSMISDTLKARGWKVLHILSTSKMEEHPYTAPARVVDGQVRYDG